MSAEASKDLVPVDGLLPGLAKSRRTLEEIADRGDKATLREASHQAAAHQEYERRNQAKEQADYYGKIKITAEALLGVMDLEENLYVHRSSFEVDGEVIDDYQRIQWRSLAAAHRIGFLDEVLAGILNEGRDLSTVGVWKEIQERGWAYLDQAPFVAAIRDYQRVAGPPRRGRIGRPTNGSRRALAEKLGCNRTTVDKYASGNHRIPLGAALKMSALLDIPVEKFKPTRVTRKSTRRRLPKQRKLIGGRLDETYSLVRKALQELDRATGQSDKWGTTEAWEHLYAAETIVGKAMKRAV